MSRFITIDCRYVMPQLAASYLREEAGEVAFIETNTALAVPHLLTALTKEGLAPEAVKYIIVTHAHLDHAGGAGELMRACPNATMLAHPSAARHLIDPAKLIASALRVYGEQLFSSLYGSIQSIEAARVCALDDGASVRLGSATLRVHHTRGHADHHFVVHDEALDAVYTGDAFGLVYPGLQRGGRLAYPSTSPKDFDGPAALSSVEMVLRLKPRMVALTHFGTYQDVSVIADQIKSWLEVSTALVEEGVTSGMEQGELEQRFKERLGQELEKAAASAGVTLSDEDRVLTGFDLQINALGLAVAAVRRRSR